MNSHLTLREVRGRLCRFFQAIGYRVLGGDRAILFERSRPWGVLPGSPPRAWPARVYALLEESSTGCSVGLKWEVGTKGRVVSVWDVAYFKREAQAALRAASGRDANLKALEGEHLAVLMKSLAVYLSAALTFTVTSVLVVLGELSFTVWGLAAVVILTLILAIRAPAKSARTAAP